MNSTSAFRLYRFRFDRFEICCNTEACRGGVGLRQYRAVRWFLLPEGELAGGRVRAAQWQIANMAQLSNCSLGRSAGFAEIFDYKSLTKRQ